MNEQMNVPKLRFGEFSEKWLAKKVHESIKITDCKHRTPEYVTEGVPIVSPGIIRWGHLDLTNAVKRVTQKEAESLMDHCSVQYNDLIFSRNQSIGIASQVKTKESFVLGQDTVLLQEKSTNIEYAYFYIQTGKFQNLIKRASGGSTFSRLNLGELKKLNISQPLLPEQQKIASFLSKVDEKIALLTEKKAKLTEYKKGVMQQLFDGSFQEQDGKLVFVPPTLRFKADDGSEFPDWEELTLGKFAVLQSGYAFSSDLFSDSGRRLITPKNFTKTGKAIFNDSNTKFTLENVDQKYLCKGGELLLLLTDLTPDCRMLGKPVLLEDDAEVLLNQRIVKFEITHPKSLSKAFVFQYFLTPKWNNRMRITATGTTVRHSSNKIVLNTTLGIPSIDEQIKISDFLSSIDRKIELVNSELDKAKEWKKGLLQQMFV